MTADVHAETTPPREVGTLTGLGAALCRIAGADNELLAACPRPDRMAYATFGLLLAAAFVWIAMTVSLGLGTVFGAGPVTLPACGFAGAMVATILVGLDRLVVIADAIAEGELALGLGEGGVFATWFKRIAFVLVRAAIALTMAVVTTELFALWLEQSAIERQLLRQHHEENRPTYAAIEAQTALIDAEIGARRGDVDALATQVAQVGAQLDLVRKGGASAQSDNLGRLERRLDTLRTTEERLVADVALNEDGMRCESDGMRCRDGDSGRSGEGKRWRMYQGRRDAAALALAEVRDEIGTAEAGIVAGLAAVAADREATMERLRRDEAALSGRLEELRGAYDAAVVDYSAAVDGRAARIAAFTAFQKNQPGFVPLSMGLSERREALAVVHAEAPTAAGFIGSLKFAMVGIELVAILAKLLMSPKTEYGMQRATQYHLRRLALRSRLEEASSAAERQGWRRDAERRGEARRRQAYRDADEALYGEHLDEVLRKARQRKENDDAEHV